MIYVCLFTSLVLLLANDCGVIAFLVVLGFASVIRVYITIDAFVFQKFRTGWDAASENILAGPIIAIIPFVWGVIQGWVKLYNQEPPPDPRLHCVHADSCHCYVARDRLIGEQGDDNAALQIQLRTAREDLAAERRLLEIVNTNLDLVTAERDRSDARTTGHYHPPGTGIMLDSRMPAPSIGRHSSSREMPNMSNFGMRKKSKNGNLDGNWTGCRIM